MGGKNVKLPHRTLALTLTIALALGLWGVALNYTPATAFSDGSILTAAQLNAEFNAIQGAVNSKLDLIGGNLSGRLNIAANALSQGSGDPSTVLDVRNSASTGHAAVFRAQTGSANPDPVVAIKGNGTGPALSVKNANSAGSLIVASNVSEIRFVVEYDGSIRVGPLGADGTGTPSLRINAATGTIANAVGSGIPVVYGTVSANGTRLAGSSTTNFTVAKSGTGTYRITVPGFDFSAASATTIATARHSNALRSTTVYSSFVSPETVLEVRTYNQAGTLVDNVFSFITYTPGM